jgi:Fic family protein
MSDPRMAHDHHELLRRICGEFLEMPGLRLTCAQAQRLFGLSEVTCRRVLEALVEREFLVRSASGMYMMLSSARAVADRRCERHVIALERTA